MAVVVTREHQAQGDWTVDIDWNPVIQDELTEVVAGKRRPRKVHVQFYDASSALIYTGVLLRVQGNEDGLTIGGRGLVWHLGTTGSPGIGPTISDQEFVSGANKLSNPNFFLGDLYWRKLSQDSSWSFVVGGAERAASSLATDDILESDEKFPTKAGNAYRLLASNVAGVGRLRVRTFYDGKFDPPNLSTVPYSGWSASLRGDITLTTDPTGIVPGPVFKIHTGYSNLAPNGGFDDPGAGLNGWVQGAGAWFTATDGTAWNPPTYAYTDTSILVAGTKRLTSSASGGTTAPAVPQTVAAGETWEVRLVVRPHPGSTTDGEAYCQISLMSGSTVVGYEFTERVKGDATGWTILRKQVLIPAGVDGLTFGAAINGHTTGRWDVDSGDIFRALGNIDRRTSPTVVLIPERTYVWTVPYRSDVGIDSGVAQLRVVLSGAGRPNIVIDGTSVDGQPDTTPLQHAPFEFTPPSGYDTAVLSVESADVDVTSWVGQGTLKDKDDKTVVFDAYIDSPVSFTPVHVDSTAPVGAEFVHAQIVAETGSGWVVSGLSLARIGVTFATGNAIVAQLLTDTTTGLPLSLVAGSVSCPEVIPYDWHLINLTNRAALEHYCNVVSNPRREYRVNPDHTIDVAEAAVLCTDHSPSSDSPIVLLREDVDVGPLPNVISDVETRATEVRVIGAERKTVSGQPILITATSPVPGTPETDWNGNVIRRTDIHSDGTVDHLGYAQALADDLAAKQADPALSMTVTLTASFDPTTGALVTRPAFREGDWIYIYEPAAGLEDRANATTINGRTVFPRKVRVFTLQRSLGPSCRIDIRKADGTTFNLADKTTVVWSPDATVLTVGDRRPDWQIDPQAGPAGVQYLRDRASAPR